MRTERTGSPTSRSRSRIWTQKTRAFETPAIKLPVNHLGFLRPDRACLGGHDLKNSQMTSVAENSWLADQHLGQVNRASSPGVPAIPHDVDLGLHATGTVRILPDLDRRAILLVSIQGRHGWIALV